MEDNLIESENLSEQYDKYKNDESYIKKICDNIDTSIEERLIVLKNHFNATKDEIEEALKFLNFSLYESQFAKAKLHVLKESKRYIISSAQNASTVNIEFLRNMEAYAKFIHAEIGIIATRYKNPTSLWIDEDVWASPVQPYLTATRQFLHKDLLLLGDFKVQATSPNPTNGIEVFGNEASVIVGSPRIEFRSVPVLPTQKQKFLYSTGTVTTPNFTDSVAGGKAAAHHSYGFVVIEVESDEVVHIRSVSASEDGSFNDLIYRVEDEKVFTEKVDILVWGDSHFAQKEEKVTFAFRKLCADLYVSTSVLHDVWDSRSINVHNIKKPIIQHKLMVEGKDDLKKELNQMYFELDWFERNMEKTYVIASNHDDMLDRAMEQSDWRSNLKNAEIFVELLMLTLSHKATNGLIPYYINNRYKKIVALGTNDSLVLNDVELGLHGHKGPNGSKGSIQSFSKLSTKTIIGHSHSPGIKWGCYQVGISCSMQHGYNDGLSSWAYAGVTLNKHGKRQMIVFHKDTLTYTTLYK